MTKRLGPLPRAAAGLALLLAAAGGAAAAAAQEAAPVRVRGQIASVEGRVLTVQNRDGGTTRLELPADAKILGMTPIQPDAIATDASVGAAAVKQPDGRMRALLVVVHPGGIGGPGEGYLTWDLTPDSMMVQGEVREAESGPDGRVLQIYYTQAGNTVVIPPGTPVIRLEPRDASLLKKGASVFVPNAEKGPGETLSAELVAVGEDGFEPPM
ncbi:MAG: hypothetical protein AVDCRST_MAG59-2310 [uncultured Thermomicrobiales bacterium]|uniref:DUF5666 domain-containing protein n=1 Tax=uncultured Thermomicrobiales bacterium TaxID=1645740 RepID=A0A6J4URJ6_9BACT|nr:MAG: hypothetical protein AVDCRST_MAG59-2310 [uncultured Thermomicrobiales bacterium]